MTQVNPNLVLKENDLLQRIFMSIPRGRGNLSNSPSQEKREKENESAQENVDPRNNILSNENIGDILQK
jgi:hypothetical protein